MNTNDLAHDFVKLCKAGEFGQAGEKYWADDVLSVEAQGENPKVQGKQAARGKGEWWENTHEVHRMEVDGPYVNGDQFAVRFRMNATFKETGQRFDMDEVALYTIKNGKIAEERFLAGG